MSNIDNSNIDIGTGIGVYNFRKNKKWKNWNKTLKDLFDIYKGDDIEKQDGDDKYMQIIRGIWKTIYSKACFYDEVKKEVEKESKNE